MTLPLLANPAPEGKRYAVLIGVNDYADRSIVDLKTPVNDVTLLESTLLASGWDSVFILKDNADYRSDSFPSRANIENRLSLLAELASPQDTVFLFFSGHGVQDPKNGQLFLPIDASLNRIQESAVSIDNMVKLLKDKGIRKTVLAVDACREQVTNTKGIGLVGISSSKDSSLQEVISLYATSPGWYSYEEKDGQNSVFTRFLIEGLKGAADGSVTSSKPDGIVSFGELANWLPGVVARYALEQGIKQKPVVNIPRTDLASLVASTGQMIKPPASTNLKPGSGKQTIMARNVSWQADQNSTEEFFDLSEYLPLKPGKAIRYKVFVDGRIADDFWEVQQDPKLFTPINQNRMTYLFTQFRKKAVDNEGKYANQVLLGGESDNTICSYSTSWFWLLPVGFAGSDSQKHLWGDTAYATFDIQKAKNSQFPDLAGAPSDSLVIKTKTYAPWDERNLTLILGKDAGILYIEGTRGDMFAGKPFVAVAVEEKILPPRKVQGQVILENGKSLPNNSLLWFAKGSVGSSIPISQKGDFSFTFYGDYINLFFGKALRDENTNLDITEDSLVNLTLGPQTDLGKVQIKLRQ